jgi:hypothetical protein
MTKKNLLLTTLLLVLATIYVVWFSGWFQPKIMHISHTERPTFRRGRRSDNLIFSVNGEFRLSEIKVVPLAVLETNWDALPVWHLISDSNSVPVRNFFYGQRIRGMRPSLGDVPADPLETNVMYRIFIKAGRVKGQQDFELK